MRCEDYSPLGNRCDLEAGHEGLHRHDKGLLPGDSRHDISTWERELRLTVPVRVTSPLRHAVDAVEVARGLAESQRRERSMEVFGHPGAHIPSAELSREEEVTVAIRAWEEANGRPNPWGDEQAGD